jgi:hypothetical protein
MQLYAFFEKENELVQILIGSLPHLLNNQFRISPILAPEIIVRLFLRHFFQESQIDSFGVEWFIYHYTISLAGISFEALMTLRFTFWMSVVFAETVVRLATCAIRVLSWVLSENETTVKS